MHELPYPPDALLTTQQVADMRNVDKDTVAKWCRDDLLPNARKVGRDWLIPAGDLDSFKPPPAGNPHRQRRAVYTPSSDPKRQTAPSSGQQSVMRALAVGGTLRWEQQYGFLLTTAAATAHVRTTTVQALLRRGYIDPEDHALTPKGIAWVEDHTN